MGIFRPQVKLMKEDEYGVEPTFDIDDPKLFILDPEEFNYNENQNIQYVETISQEDVTDAAPGNYTVNGNIPFPMRVSQMAYINYMCLGKAYLNVVNIDTDGDSKSDKTYGAEIVCVPSIDLMPSFTMWVNAVKPKRFVTITGTVFTNFRISTNSGSIVRISTDFNAQFSDTVFADDVPNRDLEAYLGPKASTVPLTPTDVAVSQDAGIYGDIEICDYDINTDTLQREDGSVIKVSDLPKEYEVIDVIYEKQDEGSGTVPTKVIIGKFMCDVKSIDLNLNITTFANDAHRIGDRRAQEYPMRLVERRDFRCDMTVDFNSSTEGLYKRFMAYMTKDNHVHANQVDYGTMSLVFKVGSPTDVIRKSPDKKDIGIKSYLFGKNIKRHYDPVGAYDRTVYIMPNIALESVGQLTMRPASRPELRVTARLLNDRNDIFKNVEFDFSTGKFKVANEKLLAITHKRFDKGTTFEVDYDSSTGDAAAFLGNLF